MCAVNTGKRSPLITKLEPSLMVPSMGTSQMLRATDNRLHRHLQNSRCRRVVYDGMRLIPVHDGTGLSDDWHLPGGEITSTSDLIRRAKRQSVNILVVE